MKKVYVGLHHDHIYISFPICLKSVFVPAAALLYTIASLYLGMPITPLYLMKMMM